MTDSKNHNGGASDVLHVGQSGDTSCLTSNSPSSTASSSTRTGTPDSNSGSSSDGGAIAGGVIGAIVFLVAAALAVWLYLRRRRGKRAQDGFGAPPAIVVNGGRGSLLPGWRNNREEIDLLTGSHEIASMSSGASLPREYEPRPYILPSDNRGTAGHSTASSSVGGAPSESGPQTTTDLTSPARQSFSTTTTQQRKAALAGVSSYTPSRFIVHTDADDTRFQDDDDDEVVELPPQYTDRRIPSNTSTSETGTGTGTGTSSQ